MRHPVEPLYLACVPMAMVPLENGMSIGLYSWDKFFGVGFLFFTWAVWWLTTIVAYVICFGVFHAMITKQKHSIREMSGAWIAPFAGLVVGSSAGAIITPFIRPLNSTMAIITTAWAFASLLIGTTMSILLMAILMYRFITEGYPSEMTIWSSFLPLSALTQAGFTIMVLGDDWASTLPVNYGSSTLLRNAAAPEIVKFMSTVTGVGLWILSTVWLMWAVIAVSTVLTRNSFRFSVNTWSFVFPVGVYAIHTQRIGVEFDSHFFLYLGNALCAITILIVFLMILRTIPPFFKGTIFHAYCLDDDEDVETPEVHTATLPELRA